MNKKERVDAALRGAQVDRVPASMWRHDFEREWDVQESVEAMVGNFTRYDWDYMKVNPRESYYVENWGVKVKPSGDKFQGPVFVSSPIRNSSDWKRIRPQEPDHGALKEQLRALQLINHAIGYDAYFVQTIPCPLGIARYLAGNKLEPVLLTLRDDRSAMHAALRVITETFTTYAIACLEQGASGIFYSTSGWANEGMLTPDQYREFGEQYDLEFFDAIKRRSKVTILHHCGARVYFDLFTSYPVQVISWETTLEGNPNLREGKLRSGKAVMGGINGQTLKSGSANQVQEEVAKALELTDSKHFLLGPESALSPETPSRNIVAIRRVLS